MSRKSRYSLKIIRRNYTYSVDEIAELYDLTPDTIFRWIRDDGLKRIANFRKYFVHSSDLRSFLEKRNSKNKHPCKDGEMFCCKCRMPRQPAPESLNIKKCPNKTIQVTGKCSLCGTASGTFVSGENWSKAHPFHPDKNTPAIQHSGEHASPRKCQTRTEAQL